MSRRSIDVAYVEARTRRPDLAVEQQAFVRFVQERLGEEVPDPDTAADLLLVAACLEGDSLALRLFDEEYMGDVPKMVARVERDPSRLSELQQRLRERLLVSRDGRPPKLADYGGKGRLGSWLRVAAIRAALDIQPKGGSERPLADDLLVDPDPELDYLRERYKTAFHDAFVAALGELAERERTVLRMHLLDGLNIDGIGKLYDVHRATAARWLERARMQLFEQTRRHLQRELGLSVSEFQSIVRLVRSELDVSVCRILREQG